MKLTKIFFLALLVCGVFQLLPAQVPLTSDDILTTIGTAFVQFGAVAEEPGPAVIGQTWDFSFVFPQNQRDIEIATYGSSGGESEYPTANQLFELEQGVYYIFNSIDENAYSYHGRYENGGANYVYSNPTDYVQFPVTFGAEFSDTYQAEYVFTGVSGSLDGAFNAIVDGYGTLQMPWGNVENTYRITRVGAQEETFANAQGVYTASVTDTTIYWVAAGYPGNLLTITKTNFAIPDLNFEQDQAALMYLGDFDFVNAVDAKIVSSLKVWPIPANEQLSISFDRPEIAIENITIRDVRGKVVFEKSLTYGSGQIELDISSVPAGIYLLTISNVLGSQSQKIVVQK